MVKTRRSTYGPTGESAASEATVQPTLPQDGEKPLKLSTSFHPDTTAFDLFRLGLVSKNFRKHARGAFTFRRRRFIRMTIFIKNKWIRGKSKDDEVLQPFLSWRNPTASIFQCIDYPPTRSPTVILEFVPTTPISFPPMLMRADQKRAIEIQFEYIPPGKTNDPIDDFVVPSTARPYPSTARPYPSTARPVLSRGLYDLPDDGTTFYGPDLIILVPSTLNITSLYIPESFT
ncbi:hypothetical protein HK097_003441 [Rhizophlyctis rosea]|uniref:Uncharacterized protein n=1 Tax=Rhizophlyctis rosea TaxID=64517 RepID=A0AAD5SGL0_9FUNG|nr:hypothetical protein HK097_003441 [Rhizophlyctis rosea]